MSDSPSKRGWKVASKPKRSGRKAAPPAPRKTIAALRTKDETSLQCIRRVSQAGTLLEPMAFYTAILTLAFDEKEEVLGLQSTLAYQQRDKRWIREMRLNCRCDFPDHWIDQHLPSTDGSRLSRPKRQEVTSTWTPATGMCKDVRLQTDPSLSVVRADAMDGSQKPEETGSADDDLDLTVDVPAHLEEPMDFTSSVSPCHPHHESGVAVDEVKKRTAPKAPEDQPPPKVRRPISPVRPPVATSASDQQAKTVPPYCPLSRCQSRDRRIKRHAVSKHLPAVFADVGSNIPGQIEALRWLVRRVYGRKTTLQTVVDKVNQSGRIPEGSFLEPCHQDVYGQACRVLELNAPREFSLHPVNSPAVLLFWRCLMTILDSCSRSLRRDFYHYRVARPTVELPDKDGREESRVVEELRVAEVSATVQGPEQSEEIEEEEFTGLEEFVVVDEASSDDEEPQSRTEQGKLEVYDSHFHLDRTSRQIWGKSSGHTVEELLSYSFSSSVIEQPSVPAAVVGGVIIYSEPNNYPPVDFTLEGPWKVAVGVHPKHCETLTVDQKLHLQRLLQHPKVVALGEFGLDRTIPIAKCRRQTEVFAKLLKMARPTQPIVLHLRGVKGDVHGTDIYRAALTMVEDVCSKEQLIHLHCFMGEADVVRAWLRRFPNTYFGVTAAVHSFDRMQLEALEAIPRDRLLLETDSPYFPLRKAKVSTPAYLGDTASLVASQLDSLTKDIAEHTTRNAVALYGL
ncbi:uncharacterized protein [Argopecten irradians]|uniref:uncharacterized protein n=1 Tax=Argopecten irradians TaxID=31199 RepID=UPI003711AFD7